MNITLNIRNYRKYAELRYIDVKTGEIIYDMVIIQRKLPDVIKAAESINEAHFNGVSITWLVEWEQAS